MSQQQIYQALIDMFANAPMKKTFGMELSYTDQGHAVFDMPYNPAFNSTPGFIHGGAMATLVDNAGWFTAAAHYGCWVMTADLNIHYLEAGQEEDMKAVGQLIRAGKRLAVCEMKLYAGERLLVSASGTFVPTPQKFEIP